MKATSGADGELSLEKESPPGVAAGRLLTTWRSLLMLSQRVDHLRLHGSVLWVQFTFMGGLMGSHHTGSSAARSCYAEQDDLDLWVGSCVQNLISI